MHSPLATKTLVGRAFAENMKIRLSNFDRSWDRLRGHFPRTPLKDVRICARCARPSPEAAERGRARTWHVGFYRYLAGNTIIEIKYERIGDVLRARCNGVVPPRPCSLAISPAGAAAPANDADQCAEEKQRDGRHDPVADEGVPQVREERAAPHGVFSRAPPAGAAHWRPARRPGSLPCAPRRACHDSARGRRRRVVRR